MPIGEMNFGRVEDLPAKSQEWRAAAFGLSATDDNDDINNNNNNKNDILYNGRPHKTVQEIVDEADEEADVAVIGRCCTVIFLPILIIFLVLSVLFGVILTSGGAPEVEGVPRAVLFIIEGMKGTTFEALLHKQRLPHLRRMLNEQKGIYAECATLEDARCARVALVEDEFTGEPYIASGAGITSILTGVTPRRHRVRNDSWKSYQAFAKESPGHTPSIALRVTKAGKRVVALGASHLLNSLDDNSGRCSVPGILDAECDAVSTTRTTTSVKSSILKKREKYSEIFTVKNKRNSNYVDGINRATADDTLPVMNCLQQRSCNLFKRVLTLSNGREGKEELQYTKYLKDLFGGLAGEVGAGNSGTSSNINSMDDSLLIFHFNALARHAEDTKLPDFTYNDDSLDYTAQAFLIDSLIGQVLSLIHSRAKSQKENWLVVGTSDHGGNDKSFGRSGDEDEVIPFFVATYTTNTRGYTRLRPLTRPVTHMDAAPTILKWLGIAPYDKPEIEEEEKEKEKEGVSTVKTIPTQNKEETKGLYLNNKVDMSNPFNNIRNENLNAKTSATSALLLQEDILDGRPQAICGSGLRPHDCKGAEV